MGADVLLEVVDHLFSMVKVLDGEENGHREGQEGDQSYDDFESEAFIKFYLFHPIFKINLDFLILIFPGSDVEGSDIR